MKLPSFRLQISLLSSLAGTALIGFGTVSWWQIYRANINRLDGQILNILMRGNAPAKAETSELYRQQRWQLYSNSLADILGVNPKIATGLLVLDTEGNRLYQSESIAEDLDLDDLLINQLAITKPPPQNLPNQVFSQKIAPPPPPPIVLTTKSTKAATWRIGTVKFRRIQLAVAIDRQIIVQEMATISQIFLISIVGLLISIAVGAWLLSRSAMSPIDRLTTAIQQVSVKGLDRRIPLDETNVEFVELIRVFNQMMERLERSFYQSSRFSADAAHELKTPLTIIQGELERMLHQVEAGSEIQQGLSNLLDQTIHLSGIMRKLLLLSLADAGQMSLYLVELDVSKLLCQMLEDMEILAPHLTLRTNIADKLIVKGDRDLLIQVLQNLLSNAIKYNVVDGWIEVIAQQTSSTVQVTIINSSQAIPIGDRDRIFERFYRGDSAHTHKIEGIGLGLNLAREIVRAHHGELVLNSTADGGTSFTISLPII
jgi:two-component system, OmpR family, heavy metal sensor histidine kinase CusS